MTTLMDPETGELVELLPTEYVQDGQPYSYAEAKAANMRASVERRGAVRAYVEAVTAQAAAEVGYRRGLATEMLRQKALHGATMAEQLAKGTEHVAALKEALIIAEGKVRAALQVIYTVDGDRTGLAQLTRWSQTISGWENQ